MCRDYRPTNAIILLGLSPKSIVKSKIFYNRFLIVLFLFPFHSPSNYYLQLKDLMGFNMIKF